VPYRGKSNEPSFVVKTLETLALTRGVSADAMAKITSDNFFNLFSKVQRLAAFNA
jgi:TatD DNase family protein